TARPQSALGLRHLSQEVPPPTCLLPAAADAPGDFRQQGRTARNPLLRFRLRSDAAQRLRNHAATPEPARLQSALRLADGAVLRADGRRRGRTSLVSGRGLRLLR